MSKLRIYLSGSVKNVKSKFQNWRSECLEFKYDGYYPNLQFIDPISYFNYADKQPKTDKQCIDLFMWQVDKCDVLLCNLDNSAVSVGTMAEIEHAFCHNIPIIAFGNKPKTWYSWAKERASVIFNTLEDAVIYINNSYGDIIN